MASQQRTFDPSLYTYEVDRAQEWVSESVEKRENKPDYFGMYANKDIKKGDVLLKASPIAWIDTSNQEDANIAMGAWTTILIGKISAEMLSGGGTKEPNVVIKDSPLMNGFSIFGQIADLYPRKPNEETRAFMQSIVNSGKQVSGAGMYSLFYYKLMINSFNISKNLKALYYTPSFFNHSCVPNAIQIFDKVEKICYIKAFRDIKENEELCVCYCDEVLSSNRNLILRAKGIDCQCDYCKHGADTVAYPWMKMCQEMAMNIDDKVCHFCRITSKEKELLVCSACRKVSYCSKDCQRIDWNIHKIVCAKLKQQ